MIFYYYFIMNIQNMLSNLGPLIGNGYRSQLNNDPSIIQGRYFLQAESKYKSGLKKDLRLIESTDSPTLGSMELKDSIIEGLEIGQESKEQLMREFNNDLKIYNDMVKLYADTINGSITNRYVLTLPLPDIDGQLGDIIIMSGNICKDGLKINEMTNFTAKNNRGNIYASWSPSYSLGWATTEEQKKNWMDTYIGNCSETGLGYYFNNANIKPETSNSVITFQQVKSIREQVRNSLKSVSERMTNIVNTIGSSTKTDASKEYESKEAIDNQIKEIRRSIMMI